jgi:energy-coupling factor transporter ATP-binding protein EcfA2
MNTQAMYALSLDQIANAIAIIGHKRTILVQGHMGNGKSSLLKTLADRFPTHTPCYFDCTTKDLGDISIPSLNTEEGYVTYLPNEEFGIHHGKPLLINIDELGKANPAVKNALNITMLEHKVGTKKLPEGSIVFATTNLSAEGVGDLLPPHTRNRITVVTARKSTSDEFIDWGISNGVDHSVLGFVREFPQVLQGFEDVKDPEDNPYIYHPKAQRAAFITPRSLEAASDVLKLRDMYDDHSLTALLMGTIGDRGAMDMMAFVKLADQLPSLQSIKDDPLNAKVPESASAVCMTVFRAMGAMQRDWVDAWVTYMQRLDKEAQGLFANGIRANSYAHRDVVMQSKEFTAWAMQNNYMFASDKV